MSYVGKASRREEDLRFLRGEGRFVADLRMPAMLEAAVLRSQVAHGRIVGIDAARARALPGVVAVYTAAEVGEVAPIATTFIPKPELAVFFQKPLARDKVRYVGEPIAFVVAESRHIAEDALELIEADIESLDPFVDARRFCDEGAAVLHEAAGTNLMDGIQAVRGDAEAALRAAPHRLKAEFATQRHTGMPMETRGLVAMVDPSDGLLTVWGPTKMINRTRRMLAGLLDIAPERIRMLEPDVGGGFGLRGEFFPEDFLVPWAALRLGRPVRWIEDRQEHFMATNHSRQQWHEVEIGFDSDGRILAMKDRAVVDLGAYLRPNGPVAPTHTVSGLPGPYRHSAFDLQLHCVTTNKTPSGSYRGPGMYEACFVRERMLDMMADALNKDPAEIRRINMIAAEEMPYRVGTYEYGHEVVFDGGDYRRTLEKVLVAIDYAGFRSRQQQARQDGRCLGIGFASFVEPTGLGFPETARIAIEPSGRVVLYSGAASIGQGVDTTMAQVCAEALGVCLGDIEVRRGDTSLIPDGEGSYGSRTAVIGGGAVHGAARQLRERVLQLAACVLNVPLSQLNLHESRVTVLADGQRSLSLARIAEAAASADAVTLPAGVQRELDVSYTFSERAETYAFGSAAATVEVDPATGMVRILKYAIVSDVGRMINPQVVEGQIIGAMAQGIGGALLEELVFDDSGQLLTTTFMDYLLPTASELPLEVSLEVLEEFPSRTNPLGAKGAGEGGIVPAGAVMANAVADALKPFGVRITQLPLSPERLRAALRKAEAR